QTDSKYFLLARGRTESFFEVPNVGEINMLLIDHQPVEFHQGKIRRDSVETVHDQGVFEQLVTERLQARIQFADGREVGQARFLLLQRADVIVGGAPLISRRAWVKQSVIDRLVLHKVEIESQRRAPHQVDVFVGSR